MIMFGTSVISFLCPLSFSALALITVELLDPNIVNVLGDLCYMVVAKMDMERLFFLPRNIT